MDVTESLTKKVQEQIGSLMFEVLKRDAMIENLGKEIDELKAALKSVPKE